MRANGGTESLLTEIMHLVDMKSGASMNGWNAESARLFALDIAMTVLRRNAAIITEVDRKNLTARLHEARTLVVNERDDELGYLQASLESNLYLSNSGRSRTVWLTAMDALLPNPYQAALVTTRNALAVASSGPFGDLADRLRDRLTARLEEASLLTADPIHLYLTA